MLEQPPQNKMMTAAPMKKEFHFAATAEHYAEVVYAETLKEATDMYHKVKRLISQDAPVTPATAPIEPAPAPITPLSTPAPAPTEEGVQS